MKKKILSVVLSSVFATATFASSSVAVVDLTQVFQQVPQGSAAFNTLKQQLAPQVTQLQTAQQTLQAQENTLEKNKSLSKAEMASQQAQLAAQSQVLQQKVQAFQQSASGQEQALLATFGNQVKGVVAQLAKQNDYDLVLSNQATLYNTADADITAQVVSILQKQAQMQTPAANAS